MASLVSARLALALLLVSSACAAAAAAPAGPAASLPAPRTTALLAACAHKRADEALALVAAASASAPGDLDAADALGWTPLMLASMSAELDEVARRLVAAGARLDATNARGLTALHLACHKQHAPSALMLVREGAALDLRDVRGKTALDYCSSGEGQAMAEVAAAIRAGGERPSKGEGEEGVASMAAEL
jgi:hypothetical protein